MSFVEYIRVKDKQTKHETSIPVGASLEGWEVLDKPGANPDGTPIPAKPHTTVAAKAAEKSSDK